MRVLLCEYCEKICVYDMHLIAGRDIRCRAPNSQSSNNQLINYCLRVRYLLRIQHYPVNNKLMIKTQQNTSCYLYVAKNYIFVLGYTLKSKQQKVNELMV